MKITHIPRKRDLHKKRVAAYCRVSTLLENQEDSFEAQVNYYTAFIESNEEWEFAGIYSDEKSGTKADNRLGFQQMVMDALDGKVDYILVKSVSRFSRNIVDCQKYVKLLHGNGIEVRFEKENLDTADPSCSMMFSFLSTISQDESHSISENVKWAYDKDEDGHLVINEDEAETVKVIFYLFLNGWSHTEIADLLTEYGRKTKLGNQVWNPTSIAGIIENERHCGYVLAHKTYTPNFKDHKSVKNNGQRTQYIDPENHEPIVSKEVYDATNKLQSSKAYAKKSRPLPLLSVVDGGILNGFVPIDKNWSGFSVEEYGN